MAASMNGKLDVVNRLLAFQKMQIRSGFALSYAYGSLYVPADLIELIAEFVM